MPPFWLVLRVSSDAVTSYFHCRYALAKADELLQWRRIHEDLLESVRSLGKSINQQMLLKDLHDTRFCNQLLESETSDDIWHSDDQVSQTGGAQFGSSARSSDDAERSHPSQGYLEATLKFQPGSFKVHTNRRSGHQI